MTAMRTHESRRVPTIEEFWEIFTKFQMESIKEREEQRKEREEERERQRKEREEERKEREEERERQRKEREKEQERKRKEQEEEQERKRKEREEEQERKRKEQEEEQERKRKEQEEEQERQRKEQERQRKEEKEWKVWRARTKKTERMINKVYANVGGLNCSLGELIETLIAARLWEKFADYPYNLKRAYQNVPVFNEDHRIVNEIDILLSNTEWVMAVEVKHRLNRTDYVDRHIERMERIRKYPPLETIGKRMVGAMAGGVVTPEIRDHIHRAGIFVLELKGESVRLAKPEVEFTPREW